MISASADEKSAIEAGLTKQPVSAEESLAILRRFIDARVARMPELSTRQAWEAYAQSLRRRLLDEVIHRGEAANWRDGPTKVEWLARIEGGPGYHIRKLRYEALPGWWIPALLYEPDAVEGRVPAVLNLGGHEAEGKAVGYKQIRCIHLAKRGMLALHPEWIGMGQLGGAEYRHGCLNQLDLCGTSGLAVFYLAMRRALDVLAEHPQADAARLAATGLSGGGWQTAWLSALDERVALANPVAGYNSLRTAIRFGDLGDSEQTPSDFFAIADGTHLTAMRAPRPTLLTLNAEDECCFRPEYTLRPLADAARPVFALFAAKDRFRWHVNYDPGTHNYERENRERFYEFVDDYFFPNERAAAWEADYKRELRSAAELEVPLPSDNLSFAKLAAQLAKDLPRAECVPSDIAELKRWQAAKRARLAELLRVPTLKAIDVERRQETSGKLMIEHLVLKLDDWKLPLTLLTRGSSGGRLALVIGDQGCASEVERIEKLLDDGWQVAAIDPLFIGASQITGSDPQVYFALAVAAVGQRPLGIQAGQLTAVARHLSQGGREVHLFAWGRRTCLAALVATSLEPGAIAGIELTDALSSLKQLIEEDRLVEDCPELFPFGLLAEFDVAQIAALAAPRLARFRGTDGRAVRDLRPAARIYALLNAAGQFRTE